jgi:hypothetical protein
MVSMAQDRADAAEDLGAVFRLEREVGPDRSQSYDEVARRGTPMDNR